MRAMIPRLVNAALGIWLMASPAVLGYDAPAQTNDRIVGPMVATFAIIAISEVTRPLRFVTAALGVWLVLAPLVLRGYPTDALVNSLVVGVLLNIFAAIRGPVTARMGGGWSALWKDEEETARRPAQRAR